MRIILLCLTGLNPQIVTETLYLLKQKEDMVPDEVHVITTSTGKDLVIKRLLDKSSGRFYTLCKDMDLTKKIVFSERTIHLINGLNGPLEDIRTTQDNKFAAVSIFSLVRKFTSDPDTAVHASMAGGRKTMGFYMGVAMHYYGRKQDRLSHVLVNSPFETHPDFFYPPKKPENIVVFQPSKGYTTISTKDAVLDLADIPFLRLRDKLDNPYYPEDYDLLVKNAQSDIDSLKKPYKLVFKVAERCISIADNKITLSPVQAAIYHYFLMQRKNKTKFISPYDIDPDLMADCIRLYWPPQSERLRNIIESLKTRSDIRDWFLQNRSRINAVISHDIANWSIREMCKIAKIGHYGNASYGIPAEPSQIEISS